MRGPRAEFERPIFDQNDRLATLRRELCDLKKFIGPLKALDKTRDDPRIRIIQQIPGEISKIEVRLVPCRDDVAEADTALHRPHQERPERGRAALAHQADRPRSDHPAPREGELAHMSCFTFARPEQLGPLMRRPDDAGEFTQFSLQVTPVVHAALGGKPAEITIAAPTPLRWLSLEDIEHLVVTHHDAHHVGGFRQIRDTVL